MSALFNFSFSVFASSRISARQASHGAPPIRRRRAAHRHCLPSACRRLPRPLVTEQSGKAFCANCLCDGCARNIFGRQNSLFESQWPAYRQTRIRGKNTARRHFHCPLRDAASHAIGVPIISAFSGRAMSGDALKNPRKPNPSLRGSW